jgi:prephenate dehydrogenase
VAEADVTALEDFIRGLGARPRRIDATAHDRSMAYISHLPQVLAVALLNAAGRSAGLPALELRGRAFDEMTRLAASPAEVWRSIAATNADFIAEALRALSDALPGDAAGLRDGRWIDAAFADAHEWTARLAPARTST